MKKILALTIMGLLLTGCFQTTQLSYSQLQKPVTASGGHVSQWGELSRVAALPMANAKCQSFDSQSRAINLKLVHKGGIMSIPEYSYWHYDCETKEVRKEKNKVELATLIEESKATCTTLGFKDGTDKFADCTLKLYAQGVELAAEQNKQIVMQPQTSGSNVMTIYDPARESRVLMNKGQRMLSGACTLGIDC